MTNRWKILRVHTQDSYLILDVEFYRLDGTWWFTEDYRFRGREGETYKPARNGLGQLLRSDGEIIPFRLNDEGVLGQWIAPDERYLDSDNLRLSPAAIEDQLDAYHAHVLTNGHARGDKRSTRPSKPDTSDARGITKLAQRSAVLEGKTRDSHRVLSR